MRPPLKALSLWRPYAPAVANGDKWIECRQSWTNHVGELAIHAAKKCAPDGEPVWEHFTGPIGTGGCVIAVVSLVACVPMRRSEMAIGATAPPDVIAIDGRAGLGLRRRGQWTTITDQEPWGWWQAGWYGYVLDAVRPLPEPVEVRGMPGMWNLTAEQTDAVYDRL